MFLRGRWIVDSELIASLHSLLMKDAITAPSEACTKGEQQRMMEESVTLRYDVVAMRKLHYMYVFASRHFYQKDCNELLLHCNWQRSRSVAKKAIQRISKRCISSKSLRREAPWRNAVPAYSLRKFHFSSFYIFFFNLLVLHSAIHSVYIRQNNIHHKPE